MHANQITASSQTLNSTTSEPGDASLPPSVSLCAGCGTKLEPSETYCCEQCDEYYRMTDPNYLMTGASDD